ncbi:hypothetical protein [Frankia tisae]|uniref:hypothetical protein n=1 Tax=Frankia tisae TaxID=2950104 RepID=UPI0021C0DFE6|nr:hypothetical protein [Frankia tisae]
MADAGGLDVAALGVIDLAAVAHRVARYERAMEAVRLRLSGAVDPRALDALTRHLARLPARPAVAFTVAVAEADLAGLRRVRALLGDEPPAGWSVAAIIVDALARREQMFGGAVVVPVPLAGSVRSLLVEALDARARRDGGSAGSDGLHALLGQLGRAAALSVGEGMSDIGPADSAPKRVELSVTEYAIRSGFTTRHVRRMARSGALPARQTAGGAWLITVEPDTDHDHRNPHACR